MFEWIMNKLGYWSNIQMLQHNYAANEQIVKSQRIYHLSLRESDLKIDRREALNNKRPVEDIDRRLKAVTDELFQIEGQS